MTIQNPTALMLQREWMTAAIMWRSYAQDWTSSRMHSRAERMKEAAAYIKRAEECEARAADAPVKIIMVFADGREEVME